MDNSRMSETVTTHEVITDIELFEKIHYRYCGREIWLDYSKFDYANPNAKPIPRDTTTDDFHNCINKKMVRLLERGLLE